MAPNPESKQKIVESGGDGIPSIEENERLAALKALKLETEMGADSPVNAIKINAKDRKAISNSGLSDESPQGSIRLQNAPSTDLETLLLHKSLQPGDLNIGTQIVAHYLRNDQ